MKTSWKAKFMINKSYQKKSCIMIKYYYTIVVV